MVLGFFNTSEKEESGKFSLQTVDQRKESLRYCLKNPPCYLGNRVTMRRVWKKEIPEIASMSNS